MCETNSTEIADLAAPYRALVGFLFGILIVVALLGNVLVCFAIAVDRKLRKNENLFLISLAASDILVALFVMSFAAINDILGEWIFGPYCSVWISSDVMCSTASILNLAAISFDRYYHIRYPMKYCAIMTREKIVGVIVAVWCVSAGISFIPIPFLPDSVYDKSSNTCQLSFGMTYTILSSTVSFFLPCIAMITAYMRMYLMARAQVALLKQQYRSMGTVVSLMVPDGKHRARARQEVRQVDTSDHKARVTVGVIMGFFLASWLPFFCVNVTRSYDSCAVPIWAFQFVTWVGYMNSTANPIIYSIFSRDFRHAFQRLLMCHKLHSLYASSAANVAGIFGSSDPLHQNGERSTAVNCTSSGDMRDYRVTLLKKYSLPRDGSVPPANTPRKASAVSNL